MLIKRPRFGLLELGISTILAAGLQPIPAIAAAGSPQELANAVTLVSFETGRTLLDISYPADLPTRNADFTACWLTQAEYAAGSNCDSHSKTAKNSQRSIFTLLYRQKAGEGKPPAENQIQQKDGLLHWKADDLDPTKLEYLRLRYEPDSTSREGRGDIAVLRVEWADGAAKFSHYVVRTRIMADNTPPVAVRLYAGGSYLFSQDNFSKLFPQLEIHLEIHFADLFGSHDWFLHGYAEAGLTATSASSAAPSADVSIAGTKTFFGQGGLGLGYGLSKTNDGDRLALLAVGRAGGYALPRDAAPANPLDPTDKRPANLLPLNTFYGLRVEFQRRDLTKPLGGLYVEFGFGESEQFTFQKSGRTKVDALIPFTGATNGALALRIQVDSHLSREHLVLGDPSAKPPTTDTVARLTTGDIKVSLLWILPPEKLLKVFGGQ